MISGWSLKTVSILCESVCASAKTLHVYAYENVYEKVHVRYMNNLNDFILVVFII